MSTRTETIFALASGALPAGVAVIRISGPASLSMVQALVGELPVPRHAALRTVSQSDGQFLDRGLVLIFPGPNSFTGEDCAELHLHGGKAVVHAVLQSLAGFDNARLAEAGEFSRRAFENGKMDLVEVEGLADLLAAETEMQRRLASEQAGGNLSAMYDTWREKLIFARSMLEAELDFSDEGDIPGSVSDRVWQDVAVLKEQIDQAVANLRAGEIIRDGFKVALAGPPNAGKSSLMNALAQRDVAIVTPIAGTTRDIIRCELDLDGYKVDLFDTAGLRDTEDPVEQEGIRRAHRTIHQADLVLQLVDLSDASAEAETLVPGAVRIGTKMDLVDLRQDTGSMRCAIGVSSLTGEGLEALRQLLVDEVRRSTNLGSLAIPSRLRHAERLKAASYFLNDALSERLKPLELRAEDLRLASTELARVTGRIDTETLLGKIFSEFCVGK
ncbi:tRNA uridine-5-carboxymethylaminomethyl(34) synthesis GTPase MnmE [Rhizobium sp. 'Codium 1']|uniref:tRNA uridine-5-carboxymethylaminomethyl(34) synthesis GTPase MnmE n=1 Tax=Rhizobium sp. 'Codium 1' TaxID=2940484 RepID=UPI001E3CA77B|nr:tRNA uridine-5-carboxymethylaminomethyl(34) synthesis GTPase MnmE [Rhizobium sp. 'Codium 1']MCC8933220.1 tRNA uridine-5-carboxymethylaminomethyl(34) synthesis GTPase MnmE [Rhizobium sp. 'Codium 1']